jgi:uncharacterized protein (TIGR02186 family)
MMMIRHNLFIVVLMLAFLLPFSSHAQEQPKSLAIALSQDEINISTGFSGTQVTLFGEQNISGDIAIVIRGPQRNIILKEKRKILGFWLSRHNAIFDQVPSFYAVASSRPIDMLSTPATLKAHQIGLDNISIKLKDESKRPDVKRRAQDAFIQTKQIDGLYVLRSVNIDYVTDSLFKVRLDFPANIAVGEYTVEAYLFQNRQLAATDKLKLNIKQVGFNAELKEFSQNRQWLYALVLITLALLFGWGATELLRRE